MAGRSPRGMETSRTLSVGCVDLKHTGPELPGDEKLIGCRIKCDSVRDSATSGHILALRRGQQIPQIDPAHDTSGSGVDASNEICLIHVRPQLTPHPLQLVEHPDCAVSLAYPERANLAESRWVHHSDLTRAVAHIQNPAVRREAPSLAGVGEAVDRGECGGIIHVPSAASPSQLIKAVAHNCDSFAELRSGDGSPATNISGLRIHLAHI